MFKEIEHNLLKTDPLYKTIREYNSLINKKPKTGSLTEKIEKQRVWKEKCQSLLKEIQNNLKIEA